MVLNRFNILVFVQVLLIALVGLLLAFSIREEFLKMTTTGLILLWLGQILYLNFYMNRIHRDVYKFMEGLRSQDTTRYFHEEKYGRYYGRLYKSFNEIIRNFRLVRIEKEVENQFYREALQRSASGLMALSLDGELRLINAAALKTLGLTGLSNLDGLDRIHPALSEKLRSGDLSDFQLKIQVEEKQVQLAVKSTEMHLDREVVRIFSLLDISREMDWQEVEAWQKLIRILNHEITNSVVPLHLLSTSLLDLYHDGKQALMPGQIDQEIVDRTVLGLNTMIKRTGGLSDFINSYKNFTDVGEADRTQLGVSRIFLHMEALLRDELDQRGLKMHWEVDPPDLQIRADEKLLEQTLINLVKNSMFALEGKKNPLIQCKAFAKDGTVCLEVSDNGRGIPEEIREQIFIPFFTTRKEGSGIGLSLARQVMQMHNGTIRVSSREGEFTTFTLSF